MAEMQDVIAGEVIEAAWGNAIRDRTLQRYADATERDTLNPSPTDGELAYLTNIDHMQVYQAGVWQGLITEYAGGVSPSFSGPKIAQDHHLRFGGVNVGAIYAGASSLRGDWVGNMAWHVDATDAYFSNIGFGGNVRIGLQFGLNVPHKARVWGGPMYVDNDFGYWAETDPDSLAVGSSPWAGGYNTGYGMFGTQGSFAQYMTYNWYRLAGGGYRFIGQGGNLGASMIKMLGDTITFGATPDYVLDGNAEPSRATARFDASSYTAASNSTIRNIFYSNGIAPSGGNDGDVWLRYGTGKGVYVKVAGTWQSVAT